MLGRNAALAEKTADRMLARSVRVIASAIRSWPQGKARTVRGIGGTFKGTIWRLRGLEQSRRVEGGDEVTKSIFSHHHDPP